MRDWSFLGFALFWFGLVAAGMALGFVMGAR